MRGEPEKSKITLAKYRSITGDWTSPDDLVLRRIAYLESLCRGVIRSELERNLRDKKG